VTCFYNDLFYRVFTIKRLCWQRRFTKILVATKMIYNLFNLTCCPEYFPFQNGIFFHQIHPQSSFNYKNTRSINTHAVTFTLIMIRTLLLLAVSASNFAHSHTLQKITLRTNIHEQMESKTKVVVSSDGRICSMSNDKIEPSPESLTWCEEYSSSSCCSPAEDKKLMEDFDTYWRSTAGHCPGCLANVKAFQCGYTCGPNQADYTTVKRKNGNGTVIGATLRMCSNFCTSFHSSCGNITIAEMEGNNANAFCQGFVRFSFFVKFCCFCFASSKLS